MLWFKFILGLIFFELVSILGTVHSLRGRGAWWDLGGVTPKKMALKGGASKKIREKRGHVKYYLYWRGVVGKNLVTGGVHATS